MNTLEQDGPPFDPNILCDTCALKPLMGSALNGTFRTPLSLKRKQCEPAASQELGGPFIVLGPSTTIPGAPLKLIPRMLISRSSLPLACLDFGSPHDEDAAPRSQFFSARVRALESLEVTDGVPCDSKILIVQNHDGHELYAVEGVQCKRYALCRLNSWVSLGDFGKGSVKARKIVHGGSATNISKADPWWKAATVELKTIDDSGRRSTSSIRGVHLAMKPPVESRPAEPVFKVSKAGVATTTDSPTEHNEQVDTINEDDMTHSTEPVDIVGMIRAQYLEALYMSKTSLAYFAKGPLSKARAAVHDPSSSMTISELNQSLREKILSISTNDKKYNETLPSLVKELPLGVTSEDESSLLCDGIRKSKKRKKISKGGLYPGEEEYAVKWWLRSEKKLSAGRAGDRHEERVRVALVEQRARETQLQIILILEILSLEATSLPIATNLSPVLATVGESTSEHPAHTKKPRKPQNLGVLLDILIDRLCIWHTTNQEGWEVAHGTPQRPNLTDSTSDCDHLRSFCVGVVVPFYATRLPLELYRSICQKLGGPLIPSPARAPLHKSSAPSRGTSKPSVAVQRTDSKPRHPLQRVLTDDKLGRRKSHPTLTRSATDSALPGIKRELSDLALAAIPTSRPSLQSSKRYSQREVDLTAVSQATEAKLQRKAAIQQELQGAIAALKKPNPRLAVKELVESADRRVAGAAKPRKSKNPVRNPLGQGVQVMATPKHNRLKNIHPRLPRQLHTAIALHEDDNVVPPSSDPRIPSSSIKPAAPPTSTHPPGLHPLLPTHITTPSHRASKPRPSLRAALPPAREGPEPGQSSTTILSHCILPTNAADDDDDDELSHPLPALPFKRPLPPGRTPSFDFPARSRLAISTPSRKGLPRGQAVVETPSRRPLGRRAQGGVVGRVGDGGVVGGGKGELEMGMGMEMEMETSIYQALGWEGDGDELGGWGRSDELG